MSEVLKEYFEKVVRAPHTVVPDELQKNPKLPLIYGVFENMTIKDDTAEVRLYNLASGGETDPRATAPHIDGMLLGHVVDSKLIYVTDLISPRGSPIERSGDTIAVGNTLREFDVDETDLTFVGGHGATIKGADITGALAANK